MYGMERPDNNLGVYDVSDEPLPGLSERYQHLVESGLEPAAIGKALRSEAEEIGLPRAAGRSAADVYNWIQDRLRLRRLVKDLGEFPAQFDWFALHVPPSGSASFEIENGSGFESGFNLKILGLGFGKGRQINFSIKESFPDRNICMRFIQHVDVHVRRYEVGSGESKSIEPMTDVVRPRHREVQPWKDCPFCGIATTDVNPLLYQIDPTGIDLRHDETSSQKTESLFIESTTKDELSLPLQVLGLSEAINAGLSRNLRTNLHCEVTWSFPGGTFFLPYRPVEAARSLPYWSVTR
jgi:hypothetical protein